MAQITFRVLEGATPERFPPGLLIQGKAGSKPYIVAADPLPGSIAGMQMHYSSGFVQDKAEDQDQLPQEVCSPQIF